MWRRILSIAPTWSTLIRVGGSTLASLAIATAVIGYLSMADGQLTIELDGVKIEAAIKGWWKVEITYLSLVSIGIGALIFRSSCPNIISEFKTNEVYLERILATSSQAQLLSLKRVIDDNYGTLNFIHPFYSKERTVLVEKSPTLDVTALTDNSTPWRRTAWLDTNSEAALSTLQAFWEIENRKLPFARLLSGVFFCIGFTGLIIPTISTAANALVD